jgi:hypothetical protein
MTSQVAPKSLREWFENQNKARVLATHAQQIKRRYPMEDIDECKSLVGLCLSYWFDSGKLDKGIEEKGGMSVSLLGEFIRRRHLNEVNKRGQEPLHRMNGARTNAEKTSIWRDGNKTAMFADAAHASEWEVVSQSLSDSDEFVLEVISPNVSPEQWLVESDESEKIEAQMRAVVRSRFAGNSERYERVFDSLKEGADRTVIAAEHGCSVTRAGHLAHRVRTAIDNREEDIEKATHVLRIIKAEPFSTREELQTELKVDFHTITRALRYLQEMDLISEKGNESYVAV